METRKITIISTKNHSTKVINSAATTLAELKSDLHSAGIDYTDCTFFEGLTKTELKNDAAILPHDVPYKGTTTNNLVFMITNASKKIRSGADRKSIIAEIKTKNLTEVVKKTYGKNYTNCKTEDLEKILNMNNTSTPKEVPAKKETAETNTSVSDNTEYVTKAQLREVIIGLVKELKDSYNIDFADDVEIDNIPIIGKVTINEDIPTKKEEESPYSSSELDVMFKDM